MSTVPDDVTIGSITVPGGASPSHVVDEAIGDDLITTVDGAVTLTTFTRGREVRKLPTVHPDVYYLVSRQTAWLAKDRDDLVFEFNGQLARYEILASPQNRVSDLWGKSRAAASERLSGFFSVETRIAGWIAVGTAFASAVLGILPDVAAEGHAEGKDRYSLLGIFFICALCCFAEAARLYRRRRKQEERRGTAYMIDEQGRGWTPEQHKAFRTDVNRQFASTLEVLPTKDIALGWDWPHDENVSQWDSKIDNMVAAFRSARQNDRDDTDNAVFVWAYWPVALAFASRLIGRSAGLTIKVQQRPSYGRLGPQTTIEWTAHRFLLSEALPDPDPALPHLRLSGTVSLRIHGPERADAPVAGILLVRLLGTQWGSLSAVDWTDSVPVVDLYNPGGLALKSDDVTLLEWRCIGSRETGIPWQQFPHLAREIANWIAEQTRDRSKTWLLGMNGPPEMAVGLGIVAEQLLREDSWPMRLLPISFDFQPRKLVAIPLDLGVHGIKPQRR